MSANDVLLRSEQTGGALGVIVNEVPAKFEGPPLHTHGFDETFYLLEGTLTFQLDDAVRTAARGELVFAPRGVPHTFANFGDAPARFVLVCTPAGFERYFARLAAKRDGVEPPDWALGPLPEVTVVGPPIRNLVRKWRDRRGSSPYAHRESDPD